MDAVTVTDKAWRFLKCEPLPPEVEQAAVRVVERASCEDDAALLLEILGLAVTGAKTCPKCGCDHKGGCLSCGCTCSGGSSCPCCGAAD